MKLNEITYAILELMRGGGIVDDERFDIRLIEAFVHSKRAEYVQQLSDSGKLIPEHFYQYTAISNKELVSNPTDGEKTYKLTGIPEIVFSRHGAMISEIVNNSPAYFSYAKNGLPFKYMTPHAFKYSGNGRFNAGMIFATYTEGFILLKSKGNLLETMQSFLVKAVLENPTDEESFDSELDEYPITVQAFEYIKNTVLGIDAKVFVSARKDITNDSTGEVI